MFSRYTGHRHIPRQLQRRRVLTTPIIAAPALLFLTAFFILGRIGGASSALLSSHHPARLLRPGSLGARRGGDPPALAFGRAPGPEAVPGGGGGRSGASAAAGVGTAVRGARSDAAAVDAAPAPASASDPRRTTAESVLKTRMYVASRNGSVLRWGSVHPPRAPPPPSGDGIHPAPLDATSLLKLLPRGAYTTCRTVGRGSAVYQFDYHAERLASSARAMIEEGGVLPPGMSELPPDAYGDVTDFGRVRESMLSCVRATAEEFRSAYGDRMYPCDEFRITLLSTWLPDEDCVDGEDGGSGAMPRRGMYCHVGILPKRRDGEHIKVEVHGHGRKNAAAKDSRWVSEREDSSEHGCEEYILVNDDGEMLEGTQTNFYLVDGDGAVLTAEDGILKGSVRDSVLRVCGERGIPLELRPPTVRDLGTASGAFLSSTSRLVLPVHEVIVNVSEEDVACAPPEPGTYHFPDCQVTKLIQELVLEDVKTHCVSIA